MKTTLPSAISTVEEAKQFLSALVANKEDYHPEDDAKDLVGGLFTEAEAAQLNKLMSDIYSLPGNENYPNLAFDPCDYIMNCQHENWDWVNEFISKEDSI